MSIKALQEYTYVSKYARFNADKNRRETYNEAIDRVMNMHISVFPQVKEEIIEAFEVAKEKRVLGSQRALQFGGTPILKKNARIYNCFGVSTEFITSEGVKSFADFKDGDTTIVLSHLGNWQKATVRCYGKDTLYRIKISRGGSPHEVLATKNHRWILKNGEYTENLKENDKLAFGPQVYSEFVYETADYLEKLYWCHGYIHGNGNLLKKEKDEYNFYSLRISVNDFELQKRFLEYSTSATLEVDTIVYSGCDLKPLPDPKKDKPSLIRAFVAGYLTAKATKNCKNRSGKLSLFKSIQVTGKEKIDFVRNCFPVAGIYITSEKNITELPINYDEKSDITIKFNIISSFGKTAKSFTVDSIERHSVDYVWCLEVENDKSFVLPFGLPTGNCIASYCDRPRFFQECFWLLLCGCGTGFSVQKHHIDKLPDFHSIYLKEKKIFVVPDTIEGWADSLGILIASFMPHPEFEEWSGYDVEFDFSEIRPAGSILASGVGKAPGPEPLRRSLEVIKSLLQDRIQSGHKRLRPIDAYDIIMHASDAVLSGGVRRSATLCMFSYDDDEMINAKTGNWFTENPQRARSNNSAVLLRDKVTKEEFFALVEKNKQFGEPGFIWSSDLEALYNPCVTADTIVTTQNGLSSVQNLIGTQFAALVDGKPYFSTENGFWKTGEKEVIELTFSSGRTLKLTDNHKLLTTTGWKETKNITFEDEVVINNHRSGQWRVSTEAVFKWNAKDKANIAKGYCLGNMLADGNLVSNTCEMKWWGEDREFYRTDALALLKDAGWDSIHHKEIQENNSVYSFLQSSCLRKFAEERNCILEEKHLDIKAIEGDWQYLAGLVAGYFDADGTVSVNHEKGCSLRITSVNLNNLRNLQIVLNSFGIYSKIYNERYPEGERLLPDGNGGMKFYHCKATHELVISCDNIQEFKKMIPIRNKIKISQIDEIIEGYKRTPNKTCFVDKVINKKFIGKRLVYDCTIDDIHAFDANGVYAHNCVEIGLYAYDEEGNSGWQACVSGDTKLLTKQGSVQIKDAVNKEIEIWNGQSWKKVVPFVTGKNKKLYRVTLSDGSYLDCTSNHKWLVKDRFQSKYTEVETKDLLSFSKYAISTPRPNIQWDGEVAQPNAYELGFILGDGCACRTDTNLGVRKTFLTLFGNDHDLNLDCRELDSKNPVSKYKVKNTNVAFDKLDNNFCHKLKYSEGLPSEIFTWDRKSCLQFIAGWLDADGTKAGRGFRIYGRKDKISDLQLLLTKLGFYSSFNLMSEAGSKTNIATRKQDIWYIQVSDPKDIVSRRIKFGGKRKHSGKGINQVVKSVVQLDGLHDTFCVYEPELNQCVFNNVLTKQCNLCEINGKKIKSKEDFAIAAVAAAKIGTLQASYTNMAYLGPISKKIIEKEALLGVSITGMMDNPDIIFDPEIQREMAQLIVKTNKEFAKKIGINPAARCTCVKPAGCQRPDTMIVSSQGILELSEIGNEKGETWQDHNFEVFTGNSHKKTTKFFVNGQTSTKQINLKTGTQIECTHNHKYKVLRDGKLEWVRADQIEIGDIIPYKIGGYESNNEGVLIPLEKIHFNSNWNLSPSKFDIDLCWLLGLYTGNGSNHKNGIRIHSNTNFPCDLVKAKDIIQEKFNINSTIEPNKKGRLTLVVNNVDLVNWFTLNNIKKSKSKDISIPKVIRTLKPELIKSFIDGYWCADGGLHVANKTRSWVTTSEKMSRQLVCVLRALGQDCSVRKMPPSETSKGNNMRYWIQENKGRMGNYKKSPFYQEFQLLDEAGLSDCYPDVVISISKSSSMTLDIEVPDGNTYLANSYISHNTTSCVLGTASGIHPHHAKRYFRRIQGNWMETPLQYFKKYNPLAVEKSVWSANGTDDVISFCVEVPKGAKTKNELSAITLLEHVLLTQNNWIAAGKNLELCTKSWLTHNVSNTINIRPEEWEEVANFIYENRENFAGISLIPQSGDLDYPQAPMCTVYNSREIVQQYGEGSLFASGLIVDGLRAFNDNLWDACDAVLGFGEAIVEPIKSDDDFIYEEKLKIYNFKSDWIRRAKQFAERYFEKDYRKMTYCLKSVHNWKLWQDLTREYVDVDYSKMIENEDNTKVNEEWACSGGKCELR